MAITAICFIAAVGWLGVRHARYSASAEVLVTPLPSDDRTFLGVQVLRDTNDPTRTAQTAAELISSPRAAELAAKKMGAGYSRQKVQDNVSVQPKGQSYVLDVQAKATDPKEAAKLANAFVSGALDARAEVLRREVAAQIAVLQGSTDPDDKARLAGLQTFASGDDPTLSLSQSAIPPTGREGAPSWLIVALSIIAGFAIGAGVAVLMELVNPRVREASELTDLFPVPVLARVPKMPRRSSRQMDVFQIPPGVREAYRSLQAQLDQRPGGPRIIMVTSASSGDGKTSTAINLALALVAAGHRVILMDFDLRKPDVGNLLGVGPSEGLVGTLNDDTLLEDVLVPAPRLPPLSVAPAGANQDDFLLLTALLREIGDIMRQARSLADYVIVDTAPLGEVSDALRLLPHVDDVIVVARPDNTRRSEFEQVRDLLSRGGVLPLGLVLMGVNMRGSARYYAYGDFREKGRRFPSLSRSAR